MGSTGSLSTGTSTTSWAKIRSAFLPLTWDRWYKGLVRDMFTNFKHLRTTKHTHHPVDDAMGNAEAMLAMIRQFGLKIKL
jgi:hypothetical protein